MLDIDTVYVSVRSCGPQRIKPQSTLNPRLTDLLFSLSCFRWKILAIHILILVFGGTNVKLIIPKLGGIYLSFYFQSNLIKFFIIFLLHPVCLNIHANAIFQIYWVEVFPHRKCRRHRWVQSLSLLIWLQPYSRYLFLVL